MTTRNSNKKITRKIDSFTINRNKAVTTNGATVISTIGLFLGLTLSVLFSNQLTVLLSNNFFLLNASSYVYEDLVIVFTNYSDFLLNSIGSVLTNFSIGWLIGGFLAGLVYGKEGAGAPVYTIRIIGTTFIPVLIVLFGITMVTAVNNTTIPGLEVFLVFLIALVIISIPLTLLGLIGYKFALVIST